MSEERETAVLAGGCYWVMQQLLGQRDGVISTRAGWTGGRDEAPTEADDAGHAEAVEVTFDPARVSYAELLRVFLEAHRPDLDAGRVGSPYRSEIFCLDAEQRRVAEAAIPAIDAAGIWPGKAVTAISEAGRFWEADAEDQGYLRRRLAGDAA